MRYPQTHRLEVDSALAAETHFLHDNFDVVLRAAENADDVAAGDVLAVVADHLEGQPQVLVREVLAVDRRS